MEILIQIIKSWWWFFFPLVLFPIARYFYFWWINWEVFFKKLKWKIIELIPPKEVKKPFSAMEQVFNSFWSILYDGPNWKQRWCEGGTLQGYGGITSIEICSFGGQIHFYLRCLEGQVQSFEAAIYAQYPDVEIIEADDYTQKIPKDIPNQIWDLYSEDYTLGVEDHFPIKIYSRFFELPSEEKRVMEEKRIDPMNTLLENLSKLKEGDQIWIQINFCPVVTDVWDWRKKGEKAVEKLAKRELPKKPKKGIIQEILGILSPATPSSKKEEKSELIAPELRLTEKEKEWLNAVETKLRKQAFQCWIRTVCVWRKDKPFTPGLFGFVRGYLMSQFSFYKQFLVFYGATRTRVHYLFRQRRLYLRKRQRLQNYIDRMPSSWPRNFYGIPFPGFIRKGPGIRPVCILCSEELATIFHFPTKIIVPSIPRVETRKLGPPPNLPTI